MILHIHKYTHANVHTKEEQEGCAWGIFLMTLSCVVSDSFFVLRETSCIHSNEAHSDTVNLSFRTLTSIVYIRGMTHLWVWHEVGTREIHPYPGHDSFLCWALRDTLFISLIRIHEIAAFMSKRAYTQSSWRPLEGKWSKARVYLLGLCVFWLLSLW